LTSVVAAQTASARPPVVVSGDLHSGPGAATPVVDHLRSGADVAYVLRRGQWLAVRNGTRLSWVHAIEGLPPIERDRSAKGPCPREDRVEVAPRAQVTVAKPTRLRDRLGFDQDRDPKLLPGMTVWVHAADRNSDWVIVETSKRAFGWVRRCEIDAGRRGAP